LSDCISSKNAIKEISQIANNELRYSKHAWNETSPIAFIELRRITCNEKRIGIEILDLGSHENDI